MQLKEVYLDRVVVELEDLAVRVAQLKTRFAKQKVSVKLEFYWELEQVRSRFAEFKRHVEELEEVGDDHIEEAQLATEAAWKEVVDAVETLRAALS
jgi:hypothetical protein